MRRTFYAVNSLKYVLRSVEEKKHNLTCFVVTKQCVVYYRPVL